MDLFTSLFAGDRPRSVKDVLFGQIELTELEWCIIDTPIYQSLRELKQLGCVHLVFPSANHTRFQHSIQVAHLSTLLLCHLQRAQPNLVIDARLVRNIRMAALMHDLGHGPLLNHFFDQLCQEGVIDVPDGMRDHEDRSCALFRMLSKQLHIFEADSIEQICAMIKGEPIDSLPNWWFEIVANHRSGIDIDKIAYCNFDAHSVGFHDRVDIQRLFQHARIIEGHLAFDEKVAQMCWDVFQLRQKMHREIYRHKTHIRLEMMMGDLIAMLSQVMCWQTMFDEKHTWRILLTDSLFQMVPHFYHSPETIEGYWTHITDLAEKARLRSLLEPMYQLYNRIMERDLYRIVGLEEETSARENHTLATTSAGAALYPSPLVIRRTCILSCSGLPGHPLDGQLCFRKQPGGYELITIRDGRVSQIDSKTSGE